MPPAKSGKSGKKAKKSTKGPKKVGAASAPCKPDDVCRWVTRMAPTAPLGNYPPSEPMPPVGGNQPWLEVLWQCYAELYTAVVHLEKLIFCKDSSITGPFIVKCPGGGGGGNKGGPPPPPVFP